MTLNELRFHGDVWDTPLRWLPDGKERRSNFLDPYRPMPEIIEREFGAVLKECMCCAAFREDVVEMTDEFEDNGEVIVAFLEVCAACRPKA